MRIAVTGASGFIGRHVLEQLVNRGLDVVAVSRRTEKLKPWQGRVVIVEMDTSEPADSAFDKLGRPDNLIHLAWEGLPNYESVHHYEKELPRQYRFLKSLIEAGLPALFVAGTCFEYGMQSGPLAETAAAEPANPYGFAKDSLRRQLEYFRSAHPYALTWGRLFYSYGEGQPGKSLYPQLKEAVLRKDKQFNMSEGEQLRDYLPIAEMARLIVELAVRKPDAGIVNICSGEPISVRRLVEFWLQENNWTISLNRGFYPHPGHEPVAFWGDRRKLDGLLASP